MSKFVCIASGPSLTEEQVSLVKAREDITVIAVNDNYKIAPFAHHLYAADTHWWELHIKEVNKVFSGKKWIPRDEVVAKKYGITSIPCEYKPGLGKNGMLHCGHHSGYQAINLAVHLGGTKIILIGYDMGVHSGKVHWFGSHPKPLRNEMRYEKWIRHFEQLGKDLAKQSIDIVNCSPTTNIPENFIRRGKLEEEL